MTPTLERMQAYVEVLARLRSRAASMRVVEVVGAFRDLAPNVVHADFRSLGVPLQEPDVDIQATYWALVRARDRIEQESLASVQVSVQHPSPEEIRDALRCRPAPPNPRVAAADAARLADSAFDMTREHPECFLLGHGRMAKDYVAFRHQLETARRVLEDMHGVALVADEVGLGKTVVAGLIIEEVLAREPDAAVLILVPPNLREQWAEKELPQFFRLRLPWNLGNDAVAVASRDQVVLLSLDAAKGSLEGPRSALTLALLRRKWDLLVVDEAHDCRNLDRLRFRFVYALNARRRVFLTATPIHNSGFDIFALVTLLRPGLLGARDGFAAEYMADERTLANAEALQNALGGVMTRALRRTSGLPFATRKPRSVVVKDFAEEERTLYDELLVILRGIYRRHMAESVQVSTPLGTTFVSQFVLTAMLVLREMASHPLAAIETLRTALWARVNEFCELTGDDSDKSKLDAFIERYRRQSWDPAHHAKSLRLLSEVAALVEQERKFIIYVNYLQTHQIVMSLLGKQHPELRILPYEGSMTPHEKMHVIRMFEDPRVRSCLVSTDAGGQGLNLQVADCVVNYDFPWNPMRVEQRVGRVDRATQASRTISILNFKTLGTVEEYVQIVLTRKLKEVVSVLGEFKSPFEIEKVYEDKLTMGIGTALMEARSADDMRRRMQRLSEGDLKRYVGEYRAYERAAAPLEWTWHAQP